MADGLWIQENRRCDVNRSTTRLPDFTNRDRFYRRTRRCTAVAIGLRRTTHEEKTGARRLRRRTEKRREEIEDERRGERRRWRKKKKKKKTQGSWRRAGEKKRDLGFFLNNNNNNNKIHIILLFYYFIIYHIIKIYTLHFLFLFYSKPNKFNTQKFLNHQISTSVKKFT